MTSKSAMSFSLKSGNIPVQKKSTSIKTGKENNDPAPRDSFDYPPRTPSPPYKYRRDALRNKQKRRELPGQECDRCNAFYTSLNLNEQQLQELKDKCSRHRDKWPIRSNTPPGLWNPNFPSSSDSD